MPTSLSRSDLEYDLVPYCDEVRDAYLRLLPEQEQSVAAGKLEWKFRNHPAGPGLIATARSGDRIVGLNAYMPGAFALDGRTVRGFQSMDTIVAPEARGLGVFPRLITSFYEKSDAALLYGFPNLNSSPGFFGKLGWVRFGPVPMLFRPLRAGYFLKRIFGLKLDFRIPVLSRGSQEAKRLESFGERATGRWQEFSRGISCAVQRDANFLNWRLIDHPVETYSILEAPDGSFVAFNLVEKHGGRIGYLMEAIGTREALPLLIAAALREMQAQGADVALAWCLGWSPNYPAYRKAGFYPLPDRIRPIRFNFGAKALSNDSGGIETARNWYISYLDSDTV
jgi:hypothetical protein